MKQKIFIYPFTFKAFKGRSITGWLTDDENELLLTEYNITIGSYDKLLSLNIDILNTYYVSKSKTKNVFVSNNTKV